MNEIDASLYLFANIEGGHTFWSNQVSELGALAVYERLLSGKYDRVKYEKLITNLVVPNKSAHWRTISSATGNANHRADQNHEHAEQHGQRDWTNHEHAEIYFAQLFRGKSKRSVAQHKPAGDHAGLARL